MAFLEKIEESNVKGGHGPITLKPCTLVVGENGAGKSGMAAEVELLLTGRCSEVGATPSAMMELAPPGEPLRVLAALSDGRMVEFSVKGTTARANKPVWSAGGETVAAPVGVLLHEEIADLLGHGAKRQREAFVSICCGAVTQEQIDKQVPDVYRKRWAAFWKRAGVAGANDADILVACAELIRAELSAAKKRAREAGEAAGDRPAAPSEEEVAAWREEAASIRAAIQAAGDARSRVLADQNRRAEAERTLPGLRLNLAELRKRVARSGDLDPQTFRDALALLGVALDLTQRAAAADTKKCTVCGGAPPGCGWEVRVSQIRAKKVEIEGRLSGMLSAPSAASIENVAQQVRAAEAVLSNAPVEALPSNPDEMQKRADRHGELNGLIETGEQARAALAAWEARQGGSTSVEGEVDVLTGLDKAAARIVADVLGASIDVFCANASAALAGDSRVAVQLFDKRRAVCRVGVTTGNSAPVRSWRSLCGAERAGLLAGLAAAWGQSRGEDVRVAITDDVWLRKPALEALCAALGGAVKIGALDQAIVCAADDYGLKPKGWEIVRVG